MALKLRFTGENVKGINILRNLNILVDGRILLKYVLMKTEFMKKLLK
jgi:hypothetical protein